MGFNLETGISALTVFIQGLLSFFSPCVLPLLPVYIGYLSGGTKSLDAEGNAYYKRSKILINTLFFVLGICFVFFFLGISFTALGQFLGDNKLLLARISGVLIILFGIYQLGIFGNSRILGTERRLPLRLDKLAMNPFTAFVLGFTFSFSWTPCVGPALTSVLLMASSAKAFWGFLLIGVYTLGFILPFLVVAFFTGTLLEFFKKHRGIMKYAPKVGGVLMIFIGISMFTGWMNSITGYLSQFSSVSSSPSSSAVSQTESEASSEALPESSPESSSQAPDRNVAAAPEFVLKDQYGVTHDLTDYRGKTIFLNFWATWCPPCLREMPSIQELYEDHGENSGDIVILSIAAPNSGQEGNEEYITSFLDENGYTYPVLMDEGGLITSQFRVYSLPTTFMIDREGYIHGYVIGAISKSNMQSIIDQTIQETSD